MADPKAGSGRAGRQRVALVCEECGARNYKKTKAKAPLRKAQDGAGTERLTLKKHCPHCNRHTVHRESK